MVLATREDLRPKVRPADINSTVWQQLARWLGKQRDDAMKDLCAANVSERESDRLRGRIEMVEEILGLTKTQTLQGDVGGYDPGFADRLHED